MDSGDSGFRKGLVGGGWVRFPIVGAAGLQLGAYFTEKGSSDTEDALTAGIELSYLEFPVMLAFMLNRTEPLSAYLAAGGAVAVQRSCRIVGSSGGVSASLDCEMTGGAGGPAFSAEELDVGLTLGGGIELDRGPIILTLDMRANFGLLEALSIYSDNFSFDTDQGQNLNLALMAGIAFPLGPRPER